MLVSKKITQLAEWNLKSLLMINETRYHKILLKYYKSLMHVTNKICSIFSHSKIYVHSSKQKP